MMFKNIIKKLVEYILTIIYQWKLKPIEVKLNIKSIIAYEQLTGKSFYQIDYENTEDILKLMYCVVLENNKEIFLYDEFLSILNNENIASEISIKFKRMYQLIEQFVKESQKLELENNSIESDEKQEIVYMKDIAGLLIVQCGINANYVMNEMNINEISIYTTAYNNKNKTNMEKERLWCFMSILPHISGNKINTPQQFYPFPWEQAIIEKENKKYENTVEELDEIFKNSIGLIEKINKQKQ